MLKKILLYVDDWFYEQILCHGGIFYAITNFNQFSSVYWTFDYCRVIDPE